MTTTRKQHGPVGQCFQRHEVLLFLTGRKRQFRRPIEMQPQYRNSMWQWSGAGHTLTSPHQRFFTEWLSILAPHVAHHRVGQVLFMQEGFAREGAPGLGSVGPIAYRADCDPWMNACPFPRAEYGRWIGPQHMRIAQARPPRWQVTGVRAEQIGMITEADIEAEGIARTDTDGWPCYSGEYGPDARVATAHSSFRTLWEALYGVPSWKQSDWVWVYEVADYQEGTPCVPGS